MDILNYKDYQGTAELDMTRGVCRGKMLFIDDVVTYEAATPTKLQKEFEVAVDDYLETCAMVGKASQRPFRGLFNVRVAPVLHRAASLRAVADGITLNDVIVRALDAFVNVGIVVNHNVHVTMETPVEASVTYPVATSVKPQWLTSHAKH